jgi:CheY-like chemotaxis protein
VVEAATGEEALSRCRERIADVLFTDIRLPGEIDGWDVAEHCRHIDPHMPVVYATGHSLAEHRPVSGSRFFLKPYRMAKIIEAIRDLLRGRAGRA